MGTRCKIFVKIKEPCILNFNPDLLTNNLNNLKETIDKLNNPVSNNGE